jgi:hypothetical protein
MTLPGFSAISSLSKAECYQARALVTALSLSAVSPPKSYSTRLHTSAIGRLGGLAVGVSYPPNGDGCQICDCTCYPVPC